MSTLRVTTVTNPSGGQPTIDGLARAWVNFNGTGTVAIRASLNVSSITDNGTGDYTVNFTTAMPDANYGVAFSCVYDSIASSGAAARANCVHSLSSSSVRVVNFYQEVGYGGYADYPSNYVSIFR
jgi:hypothetical protein